MFEDITPSPPKHRVLRVFAYDPSLTVQFATSMVNEVEIEIPWNFDDAGSPKPLTFEKRWMVGSLSLGPENEYVKVVDFDPPSGQIYRPVDLNHPGLLYSGGLPPSEQNPQFHQQMVFAVAMKTIGHFEYALGRKALWAPLVERNAQGDVQGKKRYSLQLRLYPHGIREQNAFYSPQSLSVQFGYFVASDTDPESRTESGIESGAATDKSKSSPAPAPADREVEKSLPRVGMVYSCLSHGIVAHEMTHALLDGVHPGFSYRTNGDVDAFHEAFADLVALFQHFTFSNLVRHQIVKTRGDLRKHNLLGMLAYDFGQATGRGGALRDALGTVRNGEWFPRRADHTELDRTFEPHDRGAILVAAVFDAFRTIYESRIRDLLRIATGGTGTLPDGDIHPDLVNRITLEATATAGHFLKLCIRAIDYCPPVDVSFGDYMRAMLTADYDYYPQDERNYRTAIIESFRKYGIHPRDVRSLLLDGLLWLPPKQDNADNAMWAELVKRAKFSNQNASKDSSDDDSRANQVRDMIRYADRIKKFIRSRIKDEDNPASAKSLGKCLYMAMDPRTLNKFKTVRQRAGVPLFDVQSVRLTQRVGDGSDVRSDVIIQIMQNRLGYLDPAIQQAVDEGTSGRKTPDFIFPGGCTIILDPVKSRPRFVIAKTILSSRRLREVRAYLSLEKEKAEKRSSLQDTYFGAAQRKFQAAEPFATLHRITDEREAEPWQ